MIITIMNKQNFTVHLQGCSQGKAKHFSSLASNKSQRCTYFQPMKFHSNFLLATSQPLSKITADITIVLPRIALKRVLTLQSSQVKCTPQDSINKSITRKLNLLVFVDFRFISAFLHA